MIAATTGGETTKSAANKHGPFVKPVPQDRLNPSRGQQLYSYCTKEVTFTSLAEQSLVATIYYTMVLGKSATHSLGFVLFFNPIASAVATILAMKNQTPFQLSVPTT